MMTGSAGRNSETRAIVTGGAQGIGFAVAEALADEGCRALALVGRSREKGDRAVAALKRNGADAIFISADVAKVGDCKRVVETAIDHFGTVNALVNAAATSARGSLVDTTEELFDTIFATNVKGPFFLMQGVVGHLLERNAPGSIVNVLSMSAHAGQSFLTPYSTSKGALMTLTKNVASAYRRNRIRCNAVLPGWMDTEGEDAVQKKWHGAADDWLAKAEAAQPMGQLVKPAQLARLVTYMLSPESGVMTGSLVDYDQNIAGVIGE
jgi:NAD(P)-dependent dehydrogenase (short-subunit alcohol dehydrogenase family)